MNLKNKKEFSLPFFGRDLKFIISDVAMQANAAVIGQYGGTSVLVTTVMGKEDRSIDYFPLTVDYEERFYAAGKIIGSRFIRREGRPSDMAILSGRLIDRTFRPLFNSRLRRDVQLVITILSYDEENDPDFTALMTGSLALAISDIPWGGPVGGIRVIGKNGELVFNPLNSEVEQISKEEKGVFEAFFSGTDNRINMIELGGKNASSEDVLDAFKKSHAEIKKLINFQKEIIAQVGKKKAVVALQENNPKLESEIRNFATKKLEEALYIKEKEEKDSAVSQIKSDLVSYLETAGILEISGLERIWEDLINEIIHKNILESEKRPDGRKLDEIRALYGEVGLFERLHGSSFFSRGQTQSLAVTTLAAPGSEQLVETMEMSTKRRFMLHYNFPPYSTGEVGRVGSPGRREIGHGNLAEKALRATIPSQDEFPYTIRIVSEILSSNGSSSMASVCAGTLSLMDAGVPIKYPVAGIAMGLMTHQGYDKESSKNDFKILTDIQGPEDHYGDMDLKVAGSKDGITAVQMDVKVDGITDEIFEKTLLQAEKARFQILDLIHSIIPEPRKELSKFAPIILITNIKPYQIGGVIGSGGKVINGIIEKYSLTSIDIDDEGKVYVSGFDADNVKKALDYIKSLTKEYVEGEVIEGEIIKVLDFGGIVDLGGGKDGMIHVSEIKGGYVSKASDELKVGQIVKAKVIKVDESGKIGLSIKALGLNNGANGKV